MAENNVVYVAGKAVRISIALPLTLRDLHELKSRGVDMMSMASPGDLGLDGLTTLVGYILQKANSEITEEDVLDLSLPDLTKVSNAAVTGAEVDERFLSS